MAQLSLTDCHTVQNISHVGTCRLQSHLLCKTGEFCMSMTMSLPSGPIQTPGEARDYLGEATEAPTGNMGLGELPMH